MGVQEDPIIRGRNPKRGKIASLWKIFDLEGVATLLPYLGVRVSFMGTTERNCYNLQRQKCQLKAGIFLIVTYWSKLFSYVWIEFAKTIVYL